MPGIVVVGSQWGDEGKGKVVDLLSERASMVVRYQGGSNAGHTVVVGDRVIKLHQVPSGVIRPGVRVVLGNGMVIHPPSLVEELRSLEENGYDTSALSISGNTHLVMPYHLLLDTLEETARGARALGTTRRGIGPAYTDKVARRGIRMRDFVNRDWFAERVRNALERLNPVLSRLYGHDTLDADDIIAEYEPARKRLAPHVVDTSMLVNQALQAGETVLFEGAQATLLDLDHGSYPFVTSSTATAGGACSGVGVGPTAISRVLGVTKAYTTRVGSGPFPTELQGETGAWLVERGQEYGTTTGRRRRCGWFDAVLLRYAARVNGLTGLAVTKLDVLTGLPTVRVCVGYRYNGRLIEQYLPLDVPFDRVEPVYEELPGWDEQIVDARTLDDLPAAARRYLTRLEELVRVQVEIISVGPERLQTIFVQ